MLKTQRRSEGADVRKILAYMITDRHVCSRISGEWPPEGLFGASWANFVGRLVVDHFRKYGQPPNSHMVTIFEDWASHTPAGNDEIETAERFLQDISDEDYQRLDSPEYILDLAASHFNKTSILRQIDQAKSYIEAGEIDEAVAEARRLRKVNLGTGSYLSLASDPEAWINALDMTRTAPLVGYRGDLGDFIGEDFQKGTLFAFMAVDKAGKTVWLIDLAYRAVRNRRRVAYFDTGDGSQYEVTARLALRTAKMVGPNRSQVQPVCVGWDEEGKPVVEEKEFEKVDPVTSFREFRRISRSGDQIRVSAFPSSSISAQGISDILDDWDQQDDWRPDVVIVDYADILAPMPGARTDDDLSQIDDTWKHLRRLSQERHCLVFTATQASARAYELGETGVLTKKHFAGRKTKLAHVNGMIGINVNPKEKESRSARINWIVRRGDYSNEHVVCKVGGCLAIQSPCMVSKR